jgi:hypothetical protein
MSEGCGSPISAASVIGISVTQQRLQVRLHVSCMRMFAWLAKSTLGSNSVRAVCESSQMTLQVSSSELS